MDSTPTSEPAFLLDLRRRRAELRESIGALEHALAQPASRDPAHWAERVNVALVELSADFDVHVSITEGADGLYAQVRATSPRLSHAVTALIHEHAVITSQIDELLVCTQAMGEDADKVRELGTALIATLIRHRQRGSDLVYEAYEADIGGET